MRLLLDECSGDLSLLALLQAEGHDVERAQDVGLQNRPDAELLAYCRGTGRALLTRNVRADDLVRDWEGLAAPRPLLLLVFADSHMSHANIATALANRIAAGVAQLDAKESLASWLY